MFKHSNLKARCGEFYIPHNGRSQSLIFRKGLLIPNENYSNNSADAWAMLLI
jgi:hypothetical protein